MAQDQMDSAKRKALAVSQAAHMQSLARGMMVWGLGRLPNCSPRPPLFIGSGGGAWAAQMQSP